MKNFIPFLLLSFSFCLEIVAQNPTQTIKGKILDSQSKYPLTGANVILVDSDPIYGTSTNLEGEFRLVNVPIGRQMIKVTYLGYHDRIIPNLLLTSGKEMVINIELEEMVVSIDEIIVTAEGDKATPNNELATVSARSFNPEETSRYAGSRNDPARMAANFAGVSGANDSRNDIVIRGNSPIGLLWRMEGINIPNPNHYGSVGVSGGPVSMLNYNLLSKSDFLTGAFPAQYSNALSGVFDLQLREGNKDKNEYLGQIGINGFELGAEGPVFNKTRASYLVNYRYSTLGIFQALGVDFGTGTAIPQYQDLTFKVDIPTTKAGRFSFFGMGGISNINFLGSEADTTDVNLFGSENENLYTNFRSGVTGLSHTYYYNSTTFSKVILSASHALQDITGDSLSSITRDPVPQFSTAYMHNKYSINLQLNKKFNAKNNVSGGLIFDVNDFDLKNSELISSGEFRDVRNVQGQNLLSQAYAQWQHKFSNFLTFNSGLNLLHFSLNNSTAFEPRAGLRYQFRENQSFNLGYGYHSQMQPMQTYFTDTYTNLGVIRSNKDLGFTRSQHLVLGYDNAISSKLRLKIETYYQRIFRAPVEQRPSSFSMLNAGADFVLPDNDSLVNRGTGRNYGLELTLEKFYSQGYYFLVTTSLFDSKYKGSDGILRNTTFNGRYVFNALAGKEFKVGRKNNAIGIDGKLTSAGGRFNTPLDLQKSALAGEAVYRDDQAFSVGVPDYFRADLKLYVRLNRRRLTHEFSIDIQNITDQQNVFLQRYNNRTNSITNEYQIGRNIIPQYRIVF
jgi:hypothetical protein